jgi:HSP20 family molecular chaperone IbpA
MTMAANQDVATRRGTAVEQKAEDSSTGIERKARERELPLIPAVDIFEDAHQITVQAEMPGVSKEGLNVQVDRNSLLIEGDIALDLPAGMSALYADLQSTKYRRSFVLSGELETEHIAASLKDGLLTVRIPKRAEFRTRKIKVDVPW